MYRIILSLALLIPNLTWAQSFQSLFENQRLHYSTFRDGKYIIPNETDFYLFDPYLNRRSDVLVALGTFRALEDASRGDFSHLLMLDIDLTTVYFNKMQIEFLKKSPTRQDFVAQLIGDPDYFYNHPEANEIFETGNFLLLKSTLDADDSQNMFVSRQHNLTIRKYYARAVLQLSDRSRGNHAGFLASKDRYQKLRKLALQGRMAAVRADVSGVGLTSISHVLRREGLQVSVLDLSNAPDYFLTDSADSPQEFRKTLLEVPFTKDAHILFTSELGSFMQYLNQPWNYFAVGINEYLDVLAPMNLVTSYKRFLMSPQNRQNYLNPSTAICFELFD